MPLKDAIERLTVWSSKEPILTIRRVIWVVTTGWALFLMYLFAALGMGLSIVFIPFVPSTLKFAKFALDTVTQEPYVCTPQLDESKMKKILHNPAHPLTIAANIVWLIFFGWAFALAHLFAAVVQALTIVNIMGAITNVKLARFALWPFGQDIRKKYMPKSVPDLRRHKEEEKAAKAASPGLAGTIKDTYHVGAHGGEQDSRPVGPQTV